MLGMYLVDHKLLGGSPPSPAPLPPKCIQWGFFCSSSDSHHHQHLDHLGSKINHSLHTLRLLSSDEILIPTPYFLLPTNWCSTRLLLLLLFLKSALTLSSSTTGRLYTIIILGALRLIWWSIPPNRSLAASDAIRCEWMSVYLYFSPQIVIISRNKTLDREVVEEGEGEVLAAPL